MEVNTMIEPRYSVGTWDSEAQAYTPQVGVTVPSINITLAQLRQAVRDLRRLVLRGRLSSRLLASHHRARAVHQADAAEGDV